MRGDLIIHNGKAWAAVHAFCYADYLSFDIMVFEVVCMAKAEKSWSGMRKYLEQEMLAPALSGRIRYDCAAYPGAQSAIRFQVFVDGERISQFSMETMAKAFYSGEKPADIRQFWSNYWEIKKTTEISERGVHDDLEFASALKHYRSLDIGAALASENPIVRMFAILDRRVGKRTLIRLKEHIHTQPQWLQFYYRLRLTAEGIV